MLHEIEDEEIIKPRKHKDNIKDFAETIREQNEINDFRRTESFKIITGITGKNDVLYKDLKEILDITISFCNGGDSKTKRVLTRDKTAAFVYLYELLLKNYEMASFALRHAILSNDKDK